MQLTLAVLAVIAICSSAKAACPTFRTLQNNTVADADAVMDNFNYILQCPTIVQTIGATNPDLDIRVDNGSGTSASVFTVNAATSYANVQATLPASRSLLSVGTYGDSAGIGYSAVFRGNVGIGTITPSSKLSIQQTVSATNPDLDIRVDNGSGTSASVFTVNAATSYANVQATLPASRSLLSVGTYGDSAGIGYSAVFRGNVGIGTTTPSYPLDVDGTAYATGAAGALSDLRHKTDIRPLQAGALDQIMKLRPVSFVWKNPKDAGMRGRQVGFIAQDVEKIIPTTVLTKSNSEKTKGLKYDELTAILTKAVQEQQTQIQSLRAVNAEQARALTDLRERFGALERHLRFGEANYKRSKL